jgi:hypothetical protein
MPKIGQVFNYDNIIFGSQFPDGLEFFFREADPGRIIGIGIDDG